MQLVKRVRESFPAAAIHLVLGAMVACAIAFLIFGVWYPSPYDEFSGGRNLFLILIGVDLVCGPLLTLLLYTKSKSKKLWYIDLGLIVLVQAGALLYGVHTVWQARPVYLVAEVDRFKVITQANFEDINKLNRFNLPEEFRVSIWQPPLVVGIRPPKNLEEKNRVMLESILGGRDYAERPEFYIPYDDAVAKKSKERGRQLVDFLKRHPEQHLKAQDYALSKDIKLDEIRYFPVIAKQDWIAIFDNKGYIAMFLKGDGF